jgi:ribonuclease HI
MGGSGIQVYTDSELMARQINGQYQVRKRHLFPLFTRAKDLMEQFDRARVTHVVRERNTHADRLSNLGADRAQDRN